MPGNAGKSTTARALQAANPRPLLHEAMDTFPGMLPEPLQDHPDGIAYHPGPDGTADTVGPVGARLVAVMRGAVVALADAGNDLPLEFSMRRVWPLSVSGCRHTGCRSSG